MILNFSVFLGDIPLSLQESPWRSLFVANNNWRSETYKQRAALEELFAGTGGDGWTENTGWTTMPRDLSGLFGIGIDLRGQVISIDLPENHLATLNGLPDVWAGLPWLVRLNLRGNILIHGACVCPYVCVRRCPYMSGAEHR